MGNTCGCVDPAEKDGEVQVEKTKKNQNSAAYRQMKDDTIQNYRDSTLSKNYAGAQLMQAGAIEGMPHLFDTDDQYLLDL